MNIGKREFSENYKCSWKAFITEFLQQKDLGSWSFCQYWPIILEIKSLYWLSYNCWCFHFSLHRCPDSWSTSVQRSSHWSNRSIILITRKWWVFYHLLSSSLRSPTSTGTDPWRDTLSCRHFHWQSIMAHHRPSIACPWRRGEKKTYIIYMKMNRSKDLVVLHFYLTTETYF